PLQALEMENRGYLRLGFAAVAVYADELVAQLYFAAVDFPEGNSPQVIRVIQVGHQQLESFACVRPRRGYVLDDRVEERFHGAADMLQVRLGVTIPRTGVNHRKIHLLVGR